ALADLLDRHERQPVAGGAEHELERPVLDERVHQQRRVGAHVDREEAAFERDLAVLEHADVERDGARVDAGDADQTSSLATSYTASTSSTWSLLSNRRRTHALCT